MTGLRDAVLVAATLTSGLLAGLFFAYVCSVMPALRRADDRTFVDVMQRINVAILNGWFFLVFVGALVLTAAATALHLGQAQRPMLPWLVAALVLAVVAFGVTAAANVPLNEALAAAGPPDRITDPTGVRARFETAWVRWNLARTILCTSSFGCLTLALLRHGVATGG